MEQILKNTEFDPERMKIAVSNLKSLIDKKEVTEYDLLMKYKQYIKNDEYGKAKAIDVYLTENDSHFKVADTHPHIKSINTNPWKDLRIARESGYDGFYYEFIHDNNRSRINQ